MLSSLRAPSAMILAYHDIVPTGETAAGDLSLHVDQTAFGDQLDLLAEHYDIVPLESLLDADPGRRSRVAITFDDAYVGTMTAGFEELAKRKLSATVFVPPGLLGAEGFWWDLLAPAGGGPLDPGVRDHALSALGGAQEHVLSWASAQGLERASLPPYARPVDEATLVATARQPGISLGAHTWGHPNLAALGAAEVAEEMERSKTWLREKTHQYIDWLAYPYGLRTDEVVAEAAGQFSGAVLVDGGLAQIRGTWLAPRHSIPRLNVPRGLTLAGLALRLAGFRRRP